MNHFSVNYPHIEPELSKIAYDVRDKAIQALGVSFSLNLALNVWKKLNVEGQYRLLNLHDDFLLGSGASGTVLKVASIATNTFAAMKVYHFSNENSEELAIQEANKLAPKYSIPFINFHLINFSDTDLRRVLVAGYGGRTLRQEYCNQNSLIPLSEFVPTLDAVLEYYSNLYTHFEHGDINPSNIVKDSEGQIRFIDYMDWFKCGSKCTRFFRTTRWYRSPNTLLNVIKPGDPFSLGCTLAEILTGSPLFLTHPQQGKSLSDIEDINLHLGAVFSWIPPTDAFIQQVPRHLKKQIIFTPSDPPAPIEKTLRDNLNKAVGTRITISGSREDFVNHCVSFIKMMVSYEMDLTPDMLENHPFVEFCRTTLSFSQSSL